MDNRLEICPDCEKEKLDVMERTDNGLSIGEMCQACYEKLIFKCKQRSW